jgi:hypothetical protein
VKNIIREPLVHFLLLGVGLFIAYHMMSKPGSDRPLNIVITEGQVEQLVAGFTKTWQRPPTPEELTGLVRDRVREEVYCREAMAMGLDKDDTIIRRRLRQKMEFLSDDIASLVEPTESDLNVYFRAHRDAFRLPERFTFTQVYLEPGKHGATLARDARELLAKLKQIGPGADLSSLGDPFLLEHQFTALPGSEIATQFGDEFAAKLTTLAPGQWHGPVPSGYGVHLVFLSQRTEARLPALAEVRDAVRREWDNARRLEANENIYQRLLKRYTVTVEDVPALTHLALGGAR